MPKLSGKQLFSKWLALGQAWTWFFGMLLFANGYHMLGLEYGAPGAPCWAQCLMPHQPGTPFLMETVVGVVLLCISATLFFAVIFGTVLLSCKLTTPIEMPVAEPLDPNPGAGLVRQLGAVDVWRNCTDYLFVWTHALPEGFCEYGTSLARQGRGPCLKQSGSSV